MPPCCSCATQKHMRYWCRRTLIRRYSPVIVFGSMYIIHECFESNLLHYDPSWLKWPMSVIVTPMDLKCCSNTIMPQPISTEAHALLMHMSVSMCMIYKCYESNLMHYDPSWLKWPMLVIATHMDLNCCSNATMRQPLSTEAHALLMHLSVSMGMFYMSEMGPIYWTMTHLD